MIDMNVKINYFKFYTSTIAPIFILHFDRKILQGIFWNNLKVQSLEVNLRPIEGKT